MNEIILTLILTAMLILVAVGFWSIIYHTSRKQSAGVTTRQEKLPNDWTLEYRQYANPSDTSKFERYFHHHQAIERLNQLSDSGSLFVAMIRPTSECKNVSRELLFRELETKLNTSGSYSIPYHEDSIMTYGKICDHDSGYLCKHRREWILSFLKSNFTPSPPEPPLGRVIREGATHFCSNCGSTMSRQGFIGLFGKMMCHNDKCPNSSKI
jgi:hypothetical protein